MKSLSASLSAIVLIITLFTSSVFATSENAQLVNDVIRQSGLETSLKEQLSELMELQKALLKAVRKDADAKDYLIIAKDYLIPTAAKTTDKSKQTHQYQIIHYNLLTLASENGY